MSLLYKVFANLSKVSFSYFPLKNRSEAQGILPAIHLVADDVRIGGVLLEGGFEKDPVIKTEALLLWHLGLTELCLHGEVLGDFAVGNVLHGTIPKKQIEKHWEIGIVGC